MLEWIGNANVEELEKIKNTERNCDLESYFYYKCLLNS